MSLTIDTVYRNKFEKFKNRSSQTEDHIQLKISRLKKQTFFNTVNNG